MMIDMTGNEQKELSDIATGMLFVHDKIGNANKERARAVAYERLPEWYGRLRVLVDAGMVASEEDNPHGTHKNTQ